MNPEFDYIYPACYDGEDWLALPHDARIKALYALSSQTRNLVEMKLIRDELRYYLSIQSQIEQMILSSHMRSESQ